MHWYLHSNIICQALPCTTDYFNCMIRARQLTLSGYSHSRHHGWNTIVIWVAVSTDDASFHSTRLPLSKFLVLISFASPTEETKRVLRRIMAGVPRHRESQSALLLLITNRSAFMRAYLRLAFNSSLQLPAGPNVKSLSSMVPKPIKHMFIVLIHSQGNTSYRQHFPAIS